MSSEKSSSGGYPTQQYTKASPTTEPPPQSQPQAPTLVFDQGATIKDGQIRVPPPPPGVAPTSGQVAAMQGQPVGVVKEKKDVLGGGSDGGYTMF